MIIDYLSMSIIDLGPFQLLIIAEKQKFVKPLALHFESLTEVSLWTLAGPTL